MTACRLPPAGWTCSRESGHPGPCAALPEGQQPGACSPACVHLMEPPQPAPGTELAEDRRCMFGGEDGDCKNRGQFDGLCYFHHPDTNWYRRAQADQRRKEG